MKWSRVGRGRVEVSMRDGWLGVDMPLRRDRAKPRQIRRALRREARGWHVWKVEG